MAITNSIFSLDDLDGVNGFRLDGVWVSGGSSASVSNAGDVNGDGFDDFIIGEQNARFDFVTASGASYVVFGKAAGFPVDFDLADLDGTNGFRLEGEFAFDRLGFSVSGAGDVNGDGFDDIIVGAYGAASKLAEAGASYVVFGQAAGFDAVFDLASVDGSNGFQLFGVADDDEFGYSVSGAGDVNGDGFDDLIIGAPGAGSKLEDAGHSYVLFGKAEDFDADFLIGDLDGTNGFRIDGEVERDMSGTSVSSAGDINGDGFDDLIIGAPEINRLQGQGTNGISYVVFGKAADFDAAFKLDSVDGINGFRLTGGLQSERSGWSVDSAGDVNGDGFDDLIIGAPYANNFTGSSYVVFGKAAGFSVDFDLSTLDGTNGFRLDGISSGNWTGRSVSSAGDFNGDGFDDLIIGAFQADPNQNSNSGSSFIVFGKAGGFSAIVDLGALDGSQGIRLDGVNAFDSSGISVSGAGDVNADGFDDVIIGASGADNGGSGTGSSYIIFGSDAAINSRPTGTLSIEGSPIEGQTLTANDELDDADGKGVVTYQWNTDGTPIIGANGTNFLVTQHEVGKAISVTASYTDDGGADESVTSLPTIRAAFMEGVRYLTDLDGSNGFRVDGESTSDRFGFSVSSAGDVNGDGIDDLLIGGPYDDQSASNSGTTYLVFGKADGHDPIIDLDDLSETDGFALLGVGANGNAGFSVSRAGDVNGDGFDDLIIGAPYADLDNNKTGASYVVFGKADGFGASMDLADLDGSNGFRLDGAAVDDLSGESVSAAGDINGDGFADLVVGSRAADPNASNSGSSYVVFGKATGFPAVIPLANLDGSDGFRLDGDETNDNAGLSVSGTGDINGDGFDDLVVGAFAANQNGGNSGSTYVVFGKAEPFNPAQNLVDLDGTDGFRLDGESAGNHLGYSVSDAGDVNGDGIDDLIIGSQGTDYNGSGSGSSYVVFGKTDGFQAVQQVGDLDGTNGFRLDGVEADDQAGRVVSSAGDVNGDGFADLLVGAPFADPNGASSGASYLVFGKETGFDAVMDLALLDGTNGYRLDGEAIDDNFGYSVSDAGDVNADGYDDIIVGAPRADPNGSLSGSSYVVFGEGLPGILLEGGINDDTLEGTRGEDTLIGNEGSDQLLGSFGNDDLDGGPGLDHAIFQSSLVDTSVVNSAGELTVYSPDDGKDTLVDIERLQFEDLSLAFDLDGNAGVIAKLLGVMLGAENWYNREFIGIGLDLVDNTDISSEALYDLAFSVVLGNNPTDEAVVTLIYTNLVGEAPSQQIVDSFVADLLTSGVYTQGELGIVAGDNELTATLIDLVGITNNGLEYIPII